MNWHARQISAVCGVALACGAAIVAVARHRGTPPITPRAASAAGVPVGARPPVDEVHVVDPSYRGHANADASQAASSHLSNGAELDERALMRMLRSVRGNPALAIELAREGNRRFASSPDAPERASTLVHALAAKGLASEARGEAEDMVNRYPDSAWVREIERFTGAHRRRNVRVAPNGELTFIDPAPT